MNKEEFNKLYETLKKSRFKQQKFPGWRPLPTISCITIIFISTWEFKENQISNNKTYEIKVFSSGNVMQLRAGKYGDNQIVIIYAETSNPGHNGYGNIPKGTIPKVFVVRVSDMQIIINDQTYNQLLMNTNEDLRTFRDGVLIWGTSNKDGKLVINKIGTPVLDDSYEDINTIITKEEVDAIKEGKDEESDKSDDVPTDKSDDEPTDKSDDEQTEEDEEYSEEYRQNEEGGQKDDKKSFSLSTFHIIGIVAGICLVIVGFSLILSISSTILLIVVGLFLLR